MRTGAAVGRHPDWRDALADLIRPDTGPLRRARHAPAPDSRPTHCAPSRMLWTACRSAERRPRCPSPSGLRAQVLEHLKRGLYLG